MTRDLLAGSVQHRDIVLVVDDLPDSLSVLTDALERAGLTILVAGDGLTALSVVDRIAPDLVLLDAGMPGLDGFETCRRLKASKAAAHIPVIFMTGLSETEHVIAGLEAGGVDYVTKPIVIEELLARIRVHLANARTSHSAQMALDASGRYLLAVDQSGRVKWATPQAAALLADVLTAAMDLPPELRVWLQQVGAGSDAPLIFAGARRLEFSSVGRLGPDEILLRLAEAGADAAFLQRQLRLTAREAEVLLWIGRGKSNRDISEILGISPRTVNKHLEQVFEKLGIENRASAAALAVRALGARG
jgi:DNA-binding response OmpR family regulator/DNA-binding CsgD family transcriptional regulator